VTIDEVLRRLFDYERAALHALYTAAHGLIRSRATCGDGYSAGPRG
jgi:hypothetical protein